VTERDYRTYKKGLSERKSGNVLTSKIARLFELVSHRRIMSRSLEKTKLDAKLVSVGNITFGGSGKTPHVEFLAFHFAQRGLKTGIATGGWGGSARKEGILVSDGDKIYTDFESAGDEAMSISESVLEISVPVFAHWNRIIAAEELINRFNCDAVILDDAYHFVSVEKDADILLVDSLNPLGGGHPPNTGLMREPISAIARADAIILTHADLVEKDSLDELKALIKTEKFENPVFESSYEPQSIACVYGDDIGMEKPQNAKLIPLSGLDRWQESSGYFVSSTRLSILARVPFPCIYRVMACNDPGIYRLYAGYRTGNMSGALVQLFSFVRPHIPLLLSLLQADCPRPIS